jgi:hypothetical protein
MANTFGPPGYNLPLIDPRRIRRARLRYRRDAIPELDKANTFYITAGRWPSVGWILMTRANYDKINPYATNLQLQICDLTNPPLVFKNLTVVQARCVSRGIAADPDAIYLIQITDAQGILYNPWFQYPTVSQYNVEAPAYPGTFYGGVSWTWASMIQDLWQQMALLGPFPGLPSTPAGTPEGFIFPGVSAWEALNEILDYLGFSIASNFLNTNPYAIVAVGAADNVFTALQTAQVKNLEDDLEYIDSGSGRVPAQVVVYFHRRNQFYGTEETVRADSLQWQLTPNYSVTVNGPVQFSGASGTAYLWSYFTVRYDVNNNPLAADVTTAATIAAQDAANFYSRIYRSTLGFMRQTYTGALPFVTGSQVDGVRYYQTFKQGDADERRAGWRTEIIRGFVFDDAMFPLNLKGLTGLF